MSREHSIIGDLKLNVILICHLPFIVIDRTLANSGGDWTIIIQSNEAALLRQSAFQCDIQS